MTTWNSAVIQQIFFKIFAAQKRYSILKYALKPTSFSASNTKLKRGQDKLVTKLFQGITHFSYGRARPLSGPSYVATSILVQRHIIHIAFSFDVIYDFRLFLLACRSGFCYFTTKKHLILTLTTAIKYGFLSTFTATRMQL